MDLTPERIEELELLMQRLEALDPADLPEPAADMVALLSEILEETDS
jgi:hypothetical protein